MQTQDSHDVYSYPKHFVSILFSIYFRSSSPLFLVISLHSSDLFLVHVARVTLRSVCNAFVLVGRMSIFVSSFRFLFCLRCVAHLVKMIFLVFCESVSHPSRSRFLFLIYFSFLIDLNSALDTISLFFTISFLSIHIVHNHSDRCNWLHSSL